MPGQDEGPIPSASILLFLRSGPDIPVVCVANKIDVEPNMAKKKFNFPVTHQLPFFFAPWQMSWIVLAIPAQQFPD